MSSVRPDTLLAGGEAPFFVHRQTILLKALTQSNPTAALFWEFAADGALLSNGPDLFDLFRKATAYVDRLLKGDRPADLPVQRPFEFDFVLNLRTARALGMVIPPSVLQQAAEVIQ
jgi:putative ABC transport system substrate-binding protein